MAIDPPLRLVQRNDAAGPSPTPRLDGQAPLPNPSSSTQAQHAPRIGTNNRYS